MTHPLHPNMRIFGGSQARLEDYVLKKLTGLYQRSSQPWHIKTILCRDTRILLCMRLLNGLIVLHC
jgi:hypothetical protein